MTPIAAVVAAAHVLPNMQDRAVESIDAAFSQSVV
jgi:hypothetical protein